LIFLIILIILILAGGGYFGIGYYLKTQAGPEYLFIHPTTARVFNVTPVCQATCVASGGVCGKDGKTYCNSCFALQNKAGIEHDGACLKTYTNKNFGFSITFPDSWKDYLVVQSSWDGLVIDTSKHYKGETLIFKNDKLASEKQFQGIPIMIITPDVWKLISEDKVAVSAAPIGPAKIGENAKYVFATPPRWYGFADTLDQAQINEILDIVKTFKAF
ncbi:MAG: Kazal-type serine protease inhibitor family protein, partial [Candidatus Staskawiczbacteria bacterium]|nr:Kazal-type serine protease inhibitor family protein [Candidatus Staskawiczbacteria bacterium]